MSMVLFSDYLILVLMIIAGLYIHRVPNLFATVIITGIFSLLSACLFLNMDAVDVSFTEAAVGAGIATLLFLATLAQTSDTEKNSTVSIFPLLLVFITGALLIYGIMDIMPFGQTAAPVHDYLAPRFINESPNEVGVPNMVTSVLASYRGFDTLGEVTVIFTAGVGVLVLLGRGGHGKDS